MRRFLLAAALACILAAPPAAAQTAADIAAVKRASAALAPHDDSFWLDGKPGNEQRVKTQWRAVQTWAAHWLDRHPHARSDALTRAGKVFGKDWSISAIGLAHGDMLVLATRFPVSTAFILGRGATGKYRPRWSIAAPQARLSPEADGGLAAWRVETQTGHCPGNCAVIDDSSGGRLPDAANGARRFWISGSYARDMGATGPKQLSLWSWHHGEARPLLVQDYDVMFDYKSPVLRGAVLHVPVKSDWNSLPACGMCIGRRVDLPFAVGPGPVRMLAAVSSTPEVDLVDHVFWNILAGKPVDAMASPAAARLMRGQLAGRIAEQRTRTDADLKGYAGMLTGWQRWTVHGRRWACVAVMDIGANAYAFDPKIARIVSAVPMGPKACQGKGTRD